MPLSTKKAAVHPHIRGAYLRGWTTPALCRGSSPHTWGILPISNCFIVIFRFIPTYVGHTSAPAARKAALTGSSPHTWGILTDATNQPLNVRFIPTYVGHTQIRDVPGHLGAVHPHIRGAYGICPASSDFSFGSSPHTWGIPDVATSQQAQARFIPTYVGHTSTSNLCAPLRAVHPHIRGAYFILLCQNGSSCGSSPHTWGIQPLPPLSGQQQRFIPTYVGHTGWGS